jgi:hypothetical protein
MVSQQYVLVISKNSHTKKQRANDPSTTSIIILFTAQPDTAQRFRWIKYNKKEKRLHHTIPIERKDSNGITGYRYFIYIIDI